MTWLPRRIGLDRLLAERLVGDVQIVMPFFPFLDAGFVKLYIRNWAPCSSATIGAGAPTRCLA